jgi:hypothetical protein
MQQTNSKFIRFLRRGTTSPLYGLVAMVLSALTITLLVSFAVHRHGGGMEPWAIAPLILAILVGVLGMLWIDSWSEQRRWRAGDRKGRITKLTTSLQDALSLIDSIRRDIEDRQETLRQLESRATYQREVSKLTEVEATAVRSLLQDELHRQERTSFIRSVLLGAFFFGLGVAASVLIR